MMTIRAQKARSLELTREQQEIVIGSLLGDGTWHTLHAATHFVLITVLPKKHMSIGNTKNCRSLQTLAQSATKKAIIFEQ